MSKEEFNQSSAPEVTLNEKLEKAVTIFMKKSGLEGFGMKPYVSDDGKEFGINCGGFYDLETPCIMLCMATGARVMTKTNDDYEILMVADTASITNEKFLKAAEPKKPNPVVKKIKNIFKIK